MLDKLRNEQKDLRIIILASFSSIRTLESFCIKNNIKIETYNINTVMPIDSIGLPYFFEMDKYLTIYNLKLIQKNQIETAQEYLKAIVSS